MTSSEPIPAPVVSDVTVVGGGLAGVRVVQSLRRHGFAGSVTLLAAEPHLPYDRPPLSKKIITGEVEAHEILLCDEDQLDELRIDLRTESRVAGLDAESKRLVLSDGTEHVYGKLVIATGATPKVLPGQPTLDNVHVLRTIDDGLRLREAAKGAQQACVIGGGVVAGLDSISDMDLLRHGATPSLFDVVPAPSTLGTTRRSRT
jgi:3-phenylpropionate/trans-cinnamate dioxygenase ferredoxin reductase component